jgi:hypothetical protein
LTTARQPITGKHKVQNTRKKEKHKNVRINVSKRLTTMRKQNTVFVKDVSFPTDGIASETHLSEGLDLKLR